MPVSLGSTSAAGKAVTFPSLINTSCQLSPAFERSGLNHRSSLSRPEKSIAETASSTGGRSFSEDPAFPASNTSQLLKKDGNERKVSHEGYKSLESKSRLNSSCMMYIRL
jgi:hypothetical protein